MEKKQKRYITQSVTSRFNTADKDRVYRPMPKSEMLSQDDPKSRPMLELREKLQPEVIELIKQQRLNRLCEGTCFRKISARRRQDKFWYCRLSPNHKVLHYGDIEEFSQGQISHDSLQDKVADIKAVVTGKDCPHMREKGALKNKVRINYCKRNLSKLTRCCGSKHKAYKLFYRKKMSRFFIPA